MDVTTISAFRKQSKKYFDQVLDSHAPLIMTRSDGAAIVLIALDDYNAMSETEYLNRSPANRRHLEQSIAQVRSGKTVTRTMEELRAYEQEN